MRRFYLSFLKLKLKQTFKSPGFYLIAAAACLLLFLVNRSSGEEGSCVTVLLVNAGSTRAEGFLPELLSADMDGFCFEECESVDEMTDKVRRAEAVCGFYFDQGFDSRVEKGTLKNSVPVYLSARSSSGLIAMEILYPYLLEQISDSLVEEYVLEREGEVSPGVSSALSAGSSEFRNGTRISIFDTVSFEPDPENTVSYPDTVFMLTLWLIFSAALLFGIFSLRENKPLLLAVPFKSRFFLTYEGTLCPVLILAFLLAVLFVPSRLIFVLFFGAAVCAVLSGSVLFIFKENIFYAAVPVLLAAGLFLALAASGHFGSLSGI